MRPRLVALTGPLAGSAVPLTQSRIWIGRSEQCDLALADPSAAPRQCVIEWRGGRLLLRDADRRQPTFVNGLPGGERGLEAGDEIQIGRSLFVVQFDEEPTREAVRIERPAAALQPRIVLRREDVFEGLPAQIGASPERLRRDYATLMRAGAAFSAVRGLVALARPVIELIAESVPASRGALLLTTDPSEIEPAAAWNRTTGGPIRIIEPLVDRVLRELVGIVCVDGSRPAASGAPDAAAVLAAPLVAFERPIGAIVLEADAPGNGGPDGCPFDEGHLRLVMAIAGMAATAFEHARHIEALEGARRRLQAEIDVHHNMVGESAAMQEIYRRIGRVAPSDSTVLITGESGTGKELVARAIHRNSPRADRPFVAINCAAITETLLESELFGHEKGAFTGALAQKKGKLELAEGGTVFLDEIGELSPVLQAKLLRVLQDRTFERVGGTRPVRVDFRVIAATNRDLASAIDQGTFRRDLYYRLNVVRLSMPALRDRREDIPALAAWFLEQHKGRARRPIAGFTPDALAAVTAYEWPGNVRELENAVEHAIILGQDSLITVDDLPEAIARSAARNAGGARPGGLRFREALEQTKIELITRALEEAGGSRTAAAHLLGLHPNYLHRLMRNLKMRKRR